MADEWGGTTGVRPASAPTGAESSRATNDRVNTKDGKFTVRFLAHQLGWTVPIQPFEPPATCSGVIRAATSLQNPAGKQIKHASDSDSTGYRTRAPEADKGASQSRAHNGSRS